MESEQASLVATLTLEKAAVHVGSPFRIEFEANTPTEAKLIEVIPGRKGRGDARQHFSMVFRVAMSALNRQGNYRVAHEQLGTMMLFLVPIGPDEQGMRFEAVFT